MGNEEKQRQIRIDFLNEKGKKNMKGKKDDDVDSSIPIANFMSSLEKITAPICWLLGIYLFYLLVK